MGKSSSISLEVSHWNEGCWYKLWRHVKLTLDDVSASSLVLDVVDASEIRQKYQTALSRFAERVILPLGRVFKVCKWLFVCTGRLRWVVLCLVAWTGKHVHLLWQRWTFDRVQSRRISVLQCVSSVNSITDDSSGARNDSRPTMSVSSFAIIADITLLGMTLKSLRINSRTLSHLGTLPSLMKLHTI